MHNLILHWFVTLAPVGSSEVRVCSYPLRDVMPMAILLSVPEPTHVIQPSCLDTVLAENDPEPNRSVCFNSTGQRHCIRRNWVVCISRYHICTLMPNNLGKVNPLDPDGIFCQRIRIYEKVERRLMYISNFKSSNFSDLFKRIVNCFKRAGYTLDIMRQTACLVFNPIMIEGCCCLLLLFFS